MVLRPSELPTSNPDEMVVIDRWGVGAGYMPTVNDGDIWGRLSRAQQGERFDTGLVFANATGVRLTRLSGKYFSLLFYDSRRCRVDHCSVVGGKSFAGGIAFWGVSRSAGANRDDMIDHNYVAYTAYSGIFVGGGEDFVVQENSVVHAGESGIKTGQAAGERAPLARITGNAVRGCWYDGLDLGSSYPHRSGPEIDSVAFNNVAVGDHATGLYIDGGGWVIYDNVFSRNGLAGIKSDLVDSVIDGNVIIDNNQLRSAVENQLTLGSGVGPDGDIVADNIIVNSAGLPGYGIFVSGPGAIIGRNIFLGAAVFCASAGASCGAVP